MNKTINNIYMYVIGGLIIVGFFLSLLYMMANNANSQFTTTIADMISTIKYSLVLIVGYYWGSSKSSQDKTVLLANGNNKAPQTISPASTPATDPNTAGLP